MSTTDEPQDDTLATEVFDREPVAAPGASAPTAALPTSVGAGRPQPLTPTTPSGPADPSPPGRSPAVPPAPPARPYLSGPAPFAIVLGLLGLLVAGAVLVGELTDATVQWDRLGPWTVVTAGVVVLLLGALGLRASRARD